MKKIVMSSALCATILFSASLPSKQYEYEITPFVSGILSDSSENLGNNRYYNGGIAVAKNFDGFISQIELAYLRSKKEQYEGTNYKTHINRYFVNAVKNFGLTENIAAYGLVGAGYQAVTTEISTSDLRDSPVLNYGVGLRYDLPYYGIALKGDVRHLIATKNTLNDFMFTLGLGMPLMEKETPFVAPVAPAIVETVTEVEEVIGDSDGDGVLDNVDQCPNTVAGAIVDSTGCELDDDADGIVNRLDKCPDTSAGVTVNSDGCVQTVDLKINFDYNSAVVKPQYTSRIEEFAATMKNNPSLVGKIEAHTDSIGSDRYNLKLSDRRAASVVSKIENYGVSGSKLESIGYGESQPVASNETEEGRAENRRVIGYLNQ